MTEAVEKAMAKLDRVEEVEGWTISYLEFEDGDITQPSAVYTSDKNAYRCSHIDLTCTSNGLEIDIDGVHYSSAYAEVPWAVITRLRELYEQVLNG